MRKPDLLQRLRAKKHEKERALAVAWYDELNWAMVKSTAIDPHRFESSYAEWHAMATRTPSGCTNSVVHTTFRCANSASGGTAKALSLSLAKSSALPVRAS